MKTFNTTYALDFALSASNNAAITYDVETARDFMHHCKKHRGMVGTYYSRYCYIARFKDNSSLVALNGKIHVIGFFGKHLRIKSATGFINLSLTLDEIINPP